MEHNRQIQKHVIDPERVRKIPDEGFSWVDRRFIRHGIVDRLNGPELLLYFFLCSVSDQQGLSFYGYSRICRLLKFRRATLDNARSGLIRSDLIRYEAPLYQVLSLPESHPTDPLQNLMVKPSLSNKRPQGSVNSLGDILGDIL